MSETTAPEDGFTVRIIDLSASSADNIVEEVRGFTTLSHANAFARAYVRDSVERSRLPALSSREVLAGWFAFGEDAEVVDAGGQGWRSANELDDFVASPASAEERDWRALDPRRPENDDDDEEEPSE